MGYGGDADIEILSNFLLFNVIIGAQFGKAFAEGHSITPVSAIISGTKNQYQYSIFYCRKFRILIAVFI